MQLQHPASFDITEFTQIIEVETLAGFIKNVVNFMYYNVLK